MTKQPLSEQDLAQIQARVEAATPGPWKVVFIESIHLDGSPMCLARCGKGEVPREVRPGAAVDGRDEHVFDTDFVVDFVSPDGKHVVCFGHDYDDHGGIFRPSDAEFMANARLDVPRLVSEVRRLREENARLTNALRRREDEIGSIRQEEAWRGRG